MSQINHLSLKYKGDRLEILDQTKLPLEESWVKCTNLAIMEDAIKTLKVRGAPMIGLSANFFLSVLAHQGVTVDVMLKASEVLKRSRPTAVNLIHYMNEFQSKLKKVQAFSWVEGWALEKWEEDKRASEKMSTYGVTLLKSGSKVLTHCNTGGLAAAANGTALGVIQKANDVFGNIKVYVDETRPLLQGGRLTTWELSKSNIKYKLICDSMAGFLMSQNQVDAIFVGADRIAANGDTANKIGTYSLAVLAKHHNVPFYVVAPTSTIDPHISSGKEIPIEQRPSDEVRGWVHPNEKVLWAPECDVYNPAFDVTPADLVTAWVTENGVVRDEDITQGVFLKCGQ